MTYQNPSLRQLPDGSLTREEVNELVDRIESLEAALVQIEQAVKPFDISMSGESHFQPLSPPKVKKVWDIAREALDHAT
jgi:2'-5' RNA ligase